MRTYRSKGFTMLEMVICMIILGALAGLAMTRFYSTIEYSRSSEALAAFSQIRNSMERCYLQVQTYTTCYLNSPGPDPNNLDIEDPGLSPGAHFSYRVNSPPNPQEWYTIEAFRNTIDGGNPADLIKFTYYKNGNFIKREGTGAFNAIQ